MFTNGLGVMTTKSLKAIGFIFKAIGLLYDCDKYNAEVT